MEKNNDREEELRLRKLLDDIEKDVDRSFPKDLDINYFHLFVLWLVVAAILMPPLLWLKAGWTGSFVVTLIIPAIVFALKFKPGK